MSDEMDATLDNEAEIDAYAQEKIIEEQRLEQQRKDEYEKNVSTVMFSKAKVKYICSPHSGSVLAEPEPDIVLDNNIKVCGVKCFMEYSTQNNDNVPYTIPVITDLLFDSGFNLNKELLGDIVKKIFFDSYNNIPDKIDCDMFCEILRKFYAPAYYFGQRLRKCACRGLVDELLRLIVRGCNPNTADGEGITSLHCACEFNRVTIIEKMYELIGSKLIIDPKDKYGWTPLYCAVHHGNIECVELLLRFNASVILPNSVGKSPLHCAVAQNRIDIFNILKESSSYNSDVVDYQDFTLAHEAGFKAYIEIFNEICALNSGYKLDRLGYSPQDYVDTILSDSVFGEENISREVSIELSNVDDMNLNK
jgi:ankyrin repeat protein